MEVIKRIDDMMQRCVQLKHAGAQIGLVPTMGALHQGHLSLVDAAKARADTVVLSIYVNPTQFGPKEDFSRYPRPFADDCAMAAAAGCAIVFAPDDGDMYPEPYHTFVDVEKVSAGLCGARRPGHFRGVATVVLKFFNIVRPHWAVFGQKDGQQVLVIRKLIADLNLDVRMIVAPTVRERDGLAMSSRNTYLRAEERASAPLIFEGLTAAQALFDAGERTVAPLKHAVAASMRRSPLLDIEYIEAVDTSRVTSVETIEGPVLLAVACRTTMSSTRLIDNFLLGGQW